MRFFRFSFDSNNAQDFPETTMATNDLPVMYLPLAQEVQAAAGGQRALAAYPATHGEIQRIQICLRRAYFALIWQSGRLPLVHASIT